MTGLPSGMLPVPDPTVLTTAQLYREIAHLKELTVSTFTRLESDAEHHEQLDEARHIAERLLMMTRFEERDHRFELGAVSSKQAIDKSEAATAESLRLTTVRFDELRDRVALVEAQLTGIAQNRVGSSATLAQIMSVIFLFVAVVGMGLTIIGGR